MKRIYGFGDVFSDVLSAQDADTVAGLKALQYFWQDAQVLNPQMPNDFTAFLQGLKAALVPASADVAWPGYVGVYYPNSGDAVFKQKVAGIGLMANSGGVAPGFFDTLFNSGSDVTPMTDSQVQASMQALAQMGGGKIPADFNAFTKVFTDTATTVNFLDAMWYTVAASAHDVGEGVEKVGEAALDVGAGLLKYKNLVIAGVVLFAGFLAYMRFVPRKR